MPPQLICPSHFPHNSLGTPVSSESLGKGDQKTVTVLQRNLSLGPSAIVHTVTQTWSYPFRELPKAVAGLPDASELEGS